MHDDQQNDNGGIMSKGTNDLEGKCLCCGDTVTKATVARHLNNCVVRQSRMLKTQEKGTANEGLFHLRIESLDCGYYWLNVEVSGDATLDDFDYYLRKIWLDCCGHCSSFSIGRRRGQKVSNDGSINDVFQKVEVLTHVYDYGTPSHTLIKKIGIRIGNPTTKHPIVLMARNLMPPEVCLECKAPAGWLCIECVHEHGEWGVLCEKHSKSHAHSNYGTPIPLVNSPRIGMCGYDGPAQPPY